MALYLPGLEVTGFVVAGFVDTGVVTGLVTGVVTGGSVVVIGFVVVVGAFCDPTAYVA